MYEFAARKAADQLKQFVADRDTRNCQHPAQALHPAVAAKLISIMDAAVVARG